MKTFLILIWIFEVQDNCVVNNCPVLDLAPDPPLRRSKRIAEKHTNSVPEIVEIESNEDVYFEISAHCRRSHKLYPCADVRSEHYEPYFDSGNFGDEVCCFCNALLLKSEVNESYKQKYKKNYFFFLL
uniref:Uncharacterized protein n=1 Tax=Meloidogyne enterolobii TaxID=390850 RepID=A0A6V7XRT3_MELEN|nr:unnamed protein product [Meloidogyne enterolobii]